MKVETASQRMLRVEKENDTNTENDILYDIIDIDKNKLKEYFIKNPKKVKELIYDCYTESMPFNIGKVKLADYCINSGFLIKNNKVVINDELHGNKEYQNCCKNEKHCKGHTSNYRSQCSSLCDDCQTWSCSCTGFYHCCCYHFEDGTFFN